MNLQGSVLDDLNTRIYMQLIVKSYLEYNSMTFYILRFLNFMCLIYEENGFKNLRSHFELNLYI